MRGKMISIRRCRVLYASIQQSIQCDNIQNIPSLSSLICTTYITPPVSAAKRLTRSSNSSSNSDSRSGGEAPITGGSKPVRYCRKISGSKVEVTSGAGGGGESWWLNEPFVCGCGGSISTEKRVDIDSAIDIIELLVDFEALQSRKGAVSDRRGKVGLL